MMKTRQEILKEKQIKRLKESAKIWEYNVEKYKNTAFAAVSEMHLLKKNLMIQKLNIEKK